MSVLTIRGPTLREIVIWVEQGTSFNRLGIFVVLRSTHVGGVCEFTSLVFLLEQCHEGSYSRC